MMAVTFNYAFDPAGLTDPATYYDDYTASSIKAAYMTVEESVV